MATPRKKVVSLDELGSFVWQRCDGTHTVQDILNDMISQFKLVRNEAFVSLTEFLKSLSRKGLVALFVKSASSSGGAEGQQGASEVA